MSLIDNAVHKTIARVAADDAANDSKLDQLLAGLGTLTTTITTLTKRLDAVEAEVKKPDATEPPVKDEGGEAMKKIADSLESLHGKHDALKSTCDSLMSKNDALCAKHDALSEKVDAMEEAAKQAPGGATEPPPPAVDAAGGTTEPPPAATADSATEKKLDAANQKIEGMAKLIADMQRHMPAVFSDEQKPLYTAAQAKWEKVAQLFGDSEGAPRAMNGESLPDYNRRLASRYKSHSPAWKEVDLDKLADVALDTVIGQIHADALVAAASPGPTADGVLTTREFRDKMSGRTTRKFYGDIGVMLDLSRNPRQFVTGFPALNSRH